MKRMWTMALGVAGTAAVAVGVMVNRRDSPQRANEAQQAVLVGELVDASCFVVTGGVSAGADQAECGAACMEGGAPAGLVPREGEDAGKMLFLLTNPKPLSGQVGQTVKVEGRIYRHLNAIDVDSLHVRNGMQWRKIRLIGERHQPEQASKQ